MPEPKQQSEPVEAKTSDEPGTKDPYTAIKNDGQLEADAQVILKGLIKNFALFASGGPDLHGKSSYHNLEKDVLSTINGAVVLAVTRSQYPEDQRTGGAYS